LKKTNPDFALIMRFASVVVKERCPVSRNRRSLHLVLIGTLAISFALSGCGRKGPLDPPPGALAAGTKAKDAPPVIDKQGRPVAPPGENKRIPLDALLN
jgi:predicted small lipoprotein YifL